MNPIRSETDIDTLLRSAKALAVITSWNELGLFQALAAGPKALRELPADLRALQITVPVLQHLGLLCGDGEHVSLSSTAKQLLSSKGLPSARNFEFLRDAARMLEVIHNGGPLSEQHASHGGVRHDDPEQTRAFLDMLHQRSAESAELCLEWLAPQLPAGGTMLDVGGGHGRYARAFAEAGFSATLFDFPHVVEYAKERHGKALAYIGGDFRDEGADFAGPYDLIFLSNVVHGEPEPENRKLVKRLAARLAPGGLLVLKDMFVDEHRQNPENAVFFGLTMLYYTRAGQSPALGTARQWLEAAGLDSVRVSTLEGFQLVRGRRSR